MSYSGRNEYDHSQEDHGSVEGRLNLRQSNITGPEMFMLTLNKYNI